MINDSLNVVRFAGATVMSTLFIVYALESGYCKLKISSNMKHMKDVFSFYGIASRFDDMNSTYCGENQISIHNLTCRENETNVLQ